MLFRIWSPLCFTACSRSGFQVLNHDTLRSFLFAMLRFLKSKPKIVEHQEKISAQKSGQVCNKGIIHGDRLCSHRI